MKRRKDWIKQLKQNKKLNKKQKNWSKPRKKLEQKPKNKNNQNKKL